MSALSCRLFLLFSFLSLIAPLLVSAQPGYILREMAARKPFERSSSSSTNTASSSTATATSTSTTTTQTTTSSVATASSTTHSSTVSSSSSSKTTDSFSSTSSAVPSGSSSTSSGASISTSKSVFSILSSKTVLSTSTPSSLSTVLSKSSSSPTSAPVATVTPTNNAILSTSTGVGIAQSSTALPSSTVAKENSDVSHKGFWQNHGAVAGTFTALSLVVIGIGAFFLMRLRKRQRRQKIQSDFFDRFPNSPRAFSPESGQASMTDLNHQTPMSVYPNRDIHYDNVVPPVVSNNIDYTAAHDYIGYPPGAAPVTTQQLQSQFKQQQYQQHATERIEYSNSDPFAAEPTSRATPGRTATNPFISPSSINAARNQAQERSSFQPSLDSFYGAYGDTDHAAGQAI